MTDIFLCYKTDNWHSYASRDIIGVATTKRNALTICKRQARKEGERLKGWTLEFLNEKNQTQDYAGKGEFVIEPVRKNILL